MRALKMAAAVALASSAVAMPAFAAPIIVNVTGVAGTAGAFTGTLDLDVTNGVANSGTGTISIAGLTNVPLTLITTSTPGNETAGGPQAPVGFRANDGTDIYAADQAFPIDANGLLFAVGTTTPAANQNPLIGFFNDGTNQSIFTGSVNGTEFYDQVGSLTITQAPAAAVPEAATWAMMILGMGAIGGVMRRRIRASEVKFNAKIKRISDGAVA